MITKHFFLFLKMMRYRVALMLLLFYFLAVAYHGKFTTFHIEYLYVIIILSSSYVAATTLNDIADEKIDAINHKNHAGRPLVTGEATKKDLYIVHTAAALATLLVSLSLGWFGILLATISLLINYLYSMPPIRLSYRTYFAHIFLAIAYVGIPYFFGLVSIHESFQSSDILFIFSLFFLFIGRIILKDFRDRVGDGRYNKPTLVLQYGKKVTCIASVICIVIGNVLLLWELRIENLWVIGLFGVLSATIYYAASLLWHAKENHMEQIAIGLGAKMGNGLLISSLAYLVMQYQGDIHAFDKALLLTLLIGAYLVSFYVITKHPDKASIGYKG